MKLYRNPKTGFRVLTLNPSIRLYWHFGLWKVIIGLRLLSVVIEVDIDPIAIVFKATKEGLDGLCTQRQMGIIWPWMWPWSLVYREWPIWFN